MRKFVKILSVTAVFLFLAALSAGAEEGPVFFRNIADVPVMPGLSEIYNEGFVFDKAEGRLVEARAIVRNAELKASDIRGFYEEILPRLGWRPAGESVFTRGPDRLEFFLNTDSGVPVLHLKVSPLS